MPNKFECMSTPNKGSRYDISIWDSLEEYKDYDELLKSLSKVTGEDIVKLSISSSGGRCDIGFMLIDRIMSLPCQVDVRVVYPSYSMGAIMALCGNSLLITEGSFIMFHDYSTGGRSKGNELYKSTEAYSDIFKWRFNDICQPFLTKKECTDILEGKDLYIKWNDPTLEERINRHFK